MQKLKNIILFIIGFVIGGGLLLFLYFKTAQTESWHNYIDADIQEAIETNNLDFYVLDHYVSSLRPDGKKIEINEFNEQWSYELQYQYISQKTNYECTQLLDYDEHTPMNQIAECHKK